MVAFIHITSGTSDTIVGTNDKIHKRIENKDERMNDEFDPKSTRIMTR